MKTFSQIALENETLYNQETLILQATELLSSIMEDNGVSKADLARKVGKSKAYISQCLSGEQNLTLRTLADLCGALKYSLELGAVPSSEPKCKPAHRLYPIGGWAFERQNSGTLIIDCVASEQPAAGSELCDAA
jgi:transcriptional regulator with XRE-family HTH domain